MDTLQKSRCPWCLGFPEYITYHDEEWGVPVYDDHIHFEFLVLESAQAGLSWATILRKRAGYRKAFADFDYKQVALFPESYVQELLQDKGIVQWDEDSCCHQQCPTLSGGATGIWHLHQLHLGICGRQAHP